MLQTLQRFPALLRIKFLPVLKVLLDQASACLTGLLSSCLLCSTHINPPFCSSSASTSPHPNASAELSSAGNDLPQGLPMLAHSNPLCFSSDVISSRSPLWFSLPPYDLKYLSCFSLLSPCNTLFHVTDFIAVFTIM